MNFNQSHKKFNSFIMHKIPRINCLSCPLSFCFVIFIQHTPFYIKSYSNNKNIPSRRKKEKKKKNLWNNLFFVFWRDKKKIFCESLGGIFSPSLFMGLLGVVLAFFNVDLLNLNQVCWMIGFRDYSTEDSDNLIYKLYLWSTISFLSLGFTIDILLNHEACRFEEKNLILLQDFKRDTSPRIFIVFNIWTSIEVMLN